MSNSAKEMTECVSALTMLVAALHNLMDRYPDLRSGLLQATTRLSEALPCVSSFLSIDIGEINERLTEVERRLSLLEIDVAQLKIDVAQLKIDIAQLKIDIAQLKVDVGEIKEDVALLGKDVTEVKVAIAGGNGRLDIFASKEDLHKQTWRIYGAMATLMAVFYFLVRFVH